LERWQSFGQSAVAYPMQNSQNDRDREITKSLLGAVDFISDTIGAGWIGFDFSIREYSQTNEGELADAFKEYIRAMKTLGGPDEKIPKEKVRRAALLHLSSQMNHPDVTAFVNAILDAQENSLNIYQTLKSQSRELHEKLSK
jgi:hypothetical protein